MVKLFFLFIKLKCSSWVECETYLVGFLYDAVLLLAAKVITRTGDGPANQALWKVRLPDFFAMGHVRLLHRF